METKKILEILKTAANLEPELKDGQILGVGAINSCQECHPDKMTVYEYCHVHHPKMAQLLESLPWTHIVKSPYYPKDDEYPSEAGEYLTMLDCNEHEVVCNTYREYPDGLMHWSLYDRTHIKWWMPWPDDIKDYIKERE